MIQIGGKNLNSINKVELKKFGFVVGIIFIVLGFYPLIIGKPFNFYLFLTGGIFIILALFIPNSLSIIYKAWMKVGYVLGKINTFLILSAIYFLILTPIGIISRNFGRNSEKFQFRPDKDSYWIKKTPINVKENMKKIF